MTWVEGWQGGLVLGAALSLLAEAAVRAFLFWREHRDHPHCAACRGCVRPNGRGFGAEEYLRPCAVCGDTSLKELDVKKN